jgi:hypothetical protein
MFLNRFDILILKIILKNLKNINLIYFQIKKPLLKTQLSHHFRTPLVEKLNLTKAIWIRVVAS